MVILKTCSRCKKEEGDLTPEGNPTYFIAGYKRCARCTSQNESRNARIVNERRAMYPTPHDTIVYAFKEGNEFVYIGSTKEGPLRIWEHLNKKSMKSVFHCLGINRLQREMRFSWHVLWNGDEIKNAHHQEKMLIQIHQPKFNKIKYKSYEG